MEEKQHQQVSDLRVIISQVIPALIKNVLLIVMGMGNAYPTILIPSLSSDPMFNINKEEMSWIGSINLITILIGSVISGILTQKIGRKRFMQILSIPLFASWLIFRFSREMWQILFSLSLYGLSNGLIEAPVMSYVAEIAEPRIRGMLLVLNTLSLIFGILIEFTLGTFLSWRNAAAVSCVGPLTAFILLFFIPESPHWLIMHNKLSQAQKSLAWVRGWTTVEMVEKEFQEMCCSIQRDLITKGSTKTGLSFKILKKYTKQNFYWPFLLVAFTCVVSVFNGVLTLQTYAVNIFSTFQLPFDKYYSTAVLGVVQCLGCIVNIVFVRYIGKRVITFFSLAGVAIFDCGIGVYAYLTNIDYLIMNENENVLLKESQSNWIPLTLFLFLSFVGHCGIRGLPWILMGEIFTHETRATGCGLIGATFYGLAFLANKTFLNMVDSITLAGLFWFNCGVSVVGLIILYFTLPETEGKPLQDIINHFSGISKLNNKVKRKN